MDVDIFIGRVPDSVLKQDLWRLFEEIGFLSVSQIRQNGSNFFCTVRVGASFSEEARDLVGFRLPRLPRSFNGVPLGTIELSKAGSRAPSLKAGPARVVIISGYDIHCAHSALFLEGFFSTCGKVEVVALHDAFAWVCFSDVESAHIAIERFDGRRLLDGMLRCQFSSVEPTELLALKRFTAAVADGACGSGAGGGSGIARRVGPEPLLFLPLLPSPWTMA